ncbi:MAG: protein translocase subunit SecF [Candidatus Berkelbacteria bacterium]|nr:protein translocase subunit SecF [Candidatus Berkelbacteria bacterium]
MQFLGPKKKWWFIISGLIIIPGILSLIFWGLSWGIDFKGGTLYEVKINPPAGGANVKIEQVKEAIKPLNLSDISIVATGQSNFLIKTTPVERDTIDKINQNLKEKIGDTEEIRYETVGPVVGKDLTRKAIWAISLACLGIILYIAFAFRNIPESQSSFKFGLSAIIALIHDIFVVIGIFSIIGHFFGYEVDVYFITALLTVLGFSVHDTIVVFDRIRENLKKLPGVAFETIANESIIQTLGRSINTSLTVLLTLIALFLLGGESIKPFALTLMIGITTGTYSSIFNATPILVLWQRKSKEVE